jgi:hypothetical protein
VNEITLYNNDGHAVVTIQVPPWKHPPELLIWGERFFILRHETGALYASDRYTEAAGSFFIPPPIQPEGPDAG